MCQNALAFARRNILRQSCVLYFLVSKSNKKLGSRVRHSVLPLFKSRLATSFSRCTPRHSLLVAMLGAARTRCAQTSYRLFPSIARLLTVPPNAALPPLAGNYPCNENSLTYIANFSAYNGNIKEKPAVSKSQRKSLLFGGHCARYVQTQYGNYLFLKLPYAVRSAAPDKQQKGLKWQVCDGRGMLQGNSRAEGRNDWFCLCRALLLLFTR